MAKKNLIVGQSGGPTAVINSSLYGVVSEGIRQEEIGHVYGMVNGIEGFLKGTVLDFEEALPGEKLEYLTYTPGAYLGSCRYKLPQSLEDPVYPELFRRFEEMNIGWFFYIGGNDSMDTVSKLSRYAAMIGSDILKPLTMTLCIPIIRLDLEVRPDMWLPQSARSPWMPASMRKNP